MTGLLAHPTERDLVYTRADVGGVYRWEAGSQSWTQLLTASRVPASVLDFPDKKINGEDIGNGYGRTLAYIVEGIGIDPQDPDVLYVASGENLKNPGIFMKSTDRGESFELLSLDVPCAGNSGLRTDGERWAIDPNNSNVVYFGSRNRGLWQSTNGGEDWSQLPANVLPFGKPVIVDNEPVDIGPTVLVFDAQSGTNAQGQTNRIFASVGGEGVYISENAGGSWQRLGLPASEYASDMEIVDGILYLSSRISGVYKYANNTLSQVLSDTKIADVAVDPQDNQTVYAAETSLNSFYRSTNGGGDWTKLGTNSLNEAGRQNVRSALAPWKESSTVRFSLSVGELAIDPFQSNVLWFAEGMGLWRSDDISPTNNTPILNDISQGIEEMVATDVVSAPGGNLVVGTWDRIGFHFTDPDVNPDEQISVAGRFADGVSIEAAPSDPNFIVASIADHRPCCRSGNASGYSSDGGKTWEKFGSVVQGGTIITGETGYANTPSTLNFGEIAIAATDKTNMVWVPRNDSDQGLFYTTDQGNSWEKSSLDTLADDLNFYFLTSRRALAADQVAASTFYFYSLGNDGINEVNPVPPARLFKSTDGGASFQEVSRGQLPFRVFWGQLKAAPQNEGHLWFATGIDHREPADERGLFFSNNGGQTFDKLPGVIDCWAVGFGAKQSGQAYPTIFMYGETESEGWGAYLSTDQGANWQKIVSYPLGIFDGVRTITGDYDEFGKVYIGFAGNSFVYGTPGNVSPPTPTAPAAPTALVANAVSGNQINLNWSDNSNNETGFSIERSAGDGAYSQIATVGASTTTFSDQDLPVGTYSYRVIAFNTTDSSAASNLVSIALQDEEGGDGTAYRYLRLTFESGKSVSVQEVSWLVNGTSYPNTAVTATGQTNAQGTTVLGPSYLEDYKLYDKLDDCSGGHLYVGGNLPKSVVLDLGEGNAIAPDALMISKCPSSWSELSGFMAEGSADQSAWVVLGEFSGLDSGDFPGEVGTFSFTSGTSARQASGIQEKVVIGSGLEHAEVVVYPNPSTGMVQMVLPEGALVQVYNNIGQQVDQQKLEPGRASLNLSHLPRGVYTMSINVQNAQHLHRLILE